MKKIFIFLILTAFSVGSALPILVDAASTSTLPRIAIPPRVESSSTPEITKPRRIPRTETSSTPEVRRQALTPLAPLAPQKNTLAPQAQPQTSAPTNQPQALAQPQQAAATNLIQNPSFETANSSDPSLPAGWAKGRWGTNNATFSYPVSGLNGSKAAQVSITSYTSGDAKWYFSNVPVTPGHTYQFSDYSLSNVPAEIDIEYTTTNGTQTYKYLATINPSSSFQQNTIQFTVPANISSLTIFHIIDQVGSLTVDEYSLTDLADTPPPPPPPTSGNLITNPDFETTGANGNPAGWNRDRWSNNVGTFNYPVTGVSGSKAAQVTTTNYTSGDAKWYFDPVNVTAGTYIYSDQYTATQPTELTAQFQNTDGSFSYQYLTTVPASNSFTTATASFTVSPNVQKVTIFHSLISVGSLTIDNASLISGQAPGGIFATGAVSLTFDDGWLSQYQNALPKLNSAGIKGTFYIVSQQLADNGFSDFVSQAQVRDIFNSGHEIGAHTRTHADLPTLTAADQQTEIQGSRQDLLALNVGPINSFAYPYGDYDSTTLQIVKNAGFTSARSTLNGNVVPTSDAFQLQRFSVEVNVTPDQVRQQIDNALANKQWIILTFHRVDTSGLQYSTTPDTFNQIVDYIVQKNAKVVTVSQGIQSLQ